MSDPLVLIPARLAATRLPGKPLAEIAGEPMILHVWRRAMEAGIGPVAVATDRPEIMAIVAAAGGRAILTCEDHASGSDRIHEAAEILDPDGRHDVIVNVQGDEGSAFRCARLLHRSLDVVCNPDDALTHSVESIAPGCENEVSD